MDIINRIEDYSRGIYTGAIGHFTDINDYLSSLQLKLKINFNDSSKIDRIAQLCQKTNQFNLTTKRYTEGDIKGFIENKTTKIKQ